MALVIVNKGTLDTELGEIALMGASTKRGNSKLIGEFGTGNKYGIAYLLRNGYIVSIITGGKKIEIITETVYVKNEPFEVVCFNGVRTGYTTELGYKWGLWQAIRELYSNALDEGLITFEMRDLTKEIYHKDLTYFIIEETKELQDLWLNRYQYFLMDEEPIFKCMYGEIYAKRGKNVRIFNNGIKCVNREIDSVYDYNLYNLQMTEDRIVKYVHSYVEGIHKLLACCDNASIIRNVLQGMRNDVLESEVSSLFDVHDYQDTWGEVLEKQPVFSKDFAGWLSDKERLKTYLVPSKIYNRLIGQFGNKAKPKSMKFSDNGMPYVDGDITGVRAKVLADSADFFVDTNFEMDYTIRVVNFREKNILGSIDKEKNLVLVSILALDKGVDLTINTIIEEYIHLKYGVADETRGFQDAAITELINYMKSKM